MLVDLQWPTCFLDASIRIKQKLFGDNEAVSLTCEVSLMLSERGILKIIYKQPPIFPTSTVYCLIEILQALPRGYNNVARPIL